MDPVYYGTDSSNQDVYLDSTGSYVDENGQSISVSGAIDTSSGSSGIAAAQAISSGGTSPSSSGATSPSSNASSSWISGLGSLFGSIGTTLTNVTRATKSPTINPATGLPYGINPQTGLAYPSTGTQSSLVLIILAIVIAWAVFKG